MQNPKNHAYKAGTGIVNRKNRRRRKQTVSCGVHAALASTVFDLVCFSQIRIGIGFGIRSVRGIIRVVGIVTVITTPRRINPCLLATALSVDELFGGRHDVIIVADKTWMVARREGDALTASSAGAHAMAVIGITVCTASPRCLEGLEIELK
jgi:hypothetical protein